MTKRSMIRTAAGAALLAVVTIGMIAAPGTASAFGYAGVGGKLGYASSEDLDGTAELGVHAEMEQPGTKVHLQPNLRYWKVDGLRDVSPNVDVYYHFNPEGKVTPYVGGGLGLNFMHNDRFARSDTDLGMNVMGGVRFPGEANHYFLEGRYTASDVSQASVAVGVTFHQR